MSESSEISTSSKQSPRAIGVRIAVILVFSGFCSLVYQVTWLRLLRLVFGVSTAASAAVVAIFMGGLGLGGWWIGKRLANQRRPLRFYGLLEFGIAIAAGLTPWLIDLATWIYGSTGGVSRLGLPLATGLRLVLSVFVLGAATTLMGGTLPTVCHALRRLDDSGRHQVAWLYGCNTLGAVAGAFVANFFMLELFGVRQSLWLACLLNLLLALYVRQLARHADEVPANTQADSPDLGAFDGNLLDAKASAASKSPSLAFVLPAAALVGLIFFMMEIVWYRMLGPILGGSSYTFGLILAVALLGIGLGGWLYALLAPRRRPTLADFAGTCTLEALFLMVPFALGDSLAWLTASLRSMSAVGFPGLVFGWTLVTLAVVLPASVIAGYQFPLLVALLGHQQERLGYDVGRAYAWNTAGAILGSLAGGFGLLPLLGAPLLWKLCAIALLALALVACWLERGRWSAWSRPALAAVMTMILGTVVLCFASGPSAFWRHSSIGAGRFEAASAAPNEYRKTLNEVRHSLVAEAEGVESSIALLARQQLTLQVNGKSDGSARGDAATQVMSGLIGALLHPEFERGLVIGMGTGSTAGWLAAVPSCERVDIVELEPAVVDYAEAFKWVNHEVLNSPKARIFHGDGREFVLTREETYDLIFSEPSNPYRAGVADLFSGDFYHAASKRLNPQGLFLQWLQGYEADSRTIQTVFATLASSFPYVEIWQVDRQDVILLGANEPVVHDYDRVRSRVGTEPFRSALRNTWGVEGIEGFYSAFLGGDVLTRALAAAAEDRISTDDRPRIEFHFARNVGRDIQFDIENLRAVSKTLGADRPSATGTPLAWDQVVEYRQIRASQGHGTFPRQAIEASSGDVRWRYLARNAYSAGALREAERLWSRQEDPEPRTYLDRQLMAEALADRGDSLAEPHIEAIARLAPTDALMLRALLLWRQGDPATIDTLLSAIEHCRRDGWFSYALSDRWLELIGEVAQGYPPAAPALFAALEQPFTSYLHNVRRLELRLDLAQTPEQCVEALASFEPNVPWEREFLETRQRCYEATNHPRARRAARDVRRFLEDGEPDFEMTPEVLAQAF